MESGKVYGINDFEDDCGNGVADCSVFVECLGLFYKIFVDVGNLSSLCTFGKERGSSRIGWWDEWLYCVLGDVQWTSAVAGVRLRSLPVVGPPIIVHAYNSIVLCNVS
jgi:hypothetical protein